MKGHSTYRLLNTLSIDVVAAAVACSLFLGHALGSRVSVIALVCLGLSVWIIYTVDHLLDARRITSNAVTERHAFHQRNSRFLSRAVFAVALINLFLIPILPSNIIWGGAAVGSIAVVYLVGSRHLKWMKEPFAALLFTSGLLVSTGAAWTQIIARLELIFGFFLAVLINLILFSWFDLIPDQKHESPSIANALGKRTAMAVLYALAGVVCFLCLATHWSPPLLVVFGIVLVHSVMLTGSNFFFLRERFRLIGDATFILFPALYLLWTQISLV